MYNEIICDKGFNIGGYFDSWKSLNSGGEDGECTGFGKYGSEGDESGRCYSGGYDSGNGQGMGWSDGCGGIDGCWDPNCD